MALFLKTELIGNRFTFVFLESSLRKAMQHEIGAYEALILHVSTPPNIQVGEACFYGTWT